MSAVESNFNEINWYVGRASPTCQQDSGKAPKHSSYVELRSYRRSILSRNMKSSIGIVPEIDILW